MKISKSQREEIDFMSGGTYSEQEAEEYVRNTVLGERGTENRLTERKREFDITVKMWYRDLKIGLIGYSELMENAHPFVQKVVNSLMERVIHDKNWTQFELDEAVPAITLDSRMTYVEKKHGR